ncbi:hypothetical protein DVR12_04300 [Chitinophaga silvatica]|uniref:Uncharacterized protein n=1 Tax=Chitinophaga silvatica TaxID=2282649 RepID=A0A3E1YI08_9BACT|nr:hypothetical protein [Chitinophaga silvatica]RFS27011.1 hypothetical protein DVR12_04300 [Chitinophaga silvatica]
MSDQMSYAGYACNGHGYLEPSSEQLDYNMPFTGEKETYGMPVTVGAFFGMLNNFYNFLQTNPEVADAFQDVYSIDFSKASLLRLLSQEGCEYVRFHFAIPERNQRFSLAAQGLDANQEQIGYTQLLKKATENSMLVADPSDPGAEERGNGKGGKGIHSLRQIFEALKSHNSPLATADLSHLK